MKTGIIFLIDTLETIGGTERHLFELVKRLKEGPYQPFVYSLGREGIFSRQFNDAGIDIENLDIKRVYGLDGLKAFFYLKNKIRKDKIQIIHAFHFGSQLLATVLARVTKTPLALSVRDLGFWQKWHHKFITMRIDNLADMILVNSHAIKRDLVSKDNLPGEKISVIYNGVDFDKFRDGCDASGCRKNLGIAPQQKIVAYVGWLRPEKGVDYFIEAANKILEVYSGVHFLIIGDGILRKAFQEQSKSLEIENSISFLGDRTDVPQLLSLVDLCVLPSLTEGFSNVLIEAMACGKPVVATNVGGNPEAVIEGETGFLVAPGDSQDLADKILFVLKDEGLKERLGSNGRKIARDKFDIKNIVVQYADVYESMLKGKN